MGIFAKIKEKWHSFWMPYEVTYLGAYNIKELKESENPDETLADWQQENKEKKETLLPRLAENERECLLLERYSKFPERKQIVLRQLAKQYSGLQAQKQQAKSYHQEMQNYLNNVGDVVFDEDLPRILKLIEENELEFQKVQKDLSYLEGEKSALEYEFRRGQIGFFITGITLYLSVIVAILGTIILFLLSQKHDIFVPAVALILGVGFFGAWGAVFRRYLRAALEKNMKLQQRAVKLLNKVRIKYARYRNLLDYEYKKFSISSSESLRLRYETFIQEKNQRQRYEDLEKQHRLTALDITKEIDALLPQKDDDLIDLFLKDSDYYASADGIGKLEKRLKEEKKELLSRLQELQNRENALQKMREMI